MNHITFSLNSDVDVRSYRLLLTFKGVNLNFIWLSEISPKLDLSRLDLSKTLMWDPQDWEIDPESFEDRALNGKRSSVDLGSVHLSGADLHEANWSNVILRHADLSFVDLHRIDLRNVDLREARLCH